MSAEPTPSTRGCAVASLHWLGFLALFPATTCLVGLLIAGVGFVLVGQGAVDLGAVLEPEQLMGAGFLGVSAIVQIGMMVAGSALLAVLLPRGEEPDTAVTLTAAHQLTAFAIRRAHPSWLLAGVLGALTIGLLPGWAASRLMEIESLAPFVEGMKLVAEALENTADPYWAVLAFAVVISAPVCEELIFRGFLWRAASYGLPQVGVWLATSVLFAAYHMNPIHVVAVLPIGLFLGWLRWWSGSIWPGIAGHFANNALALVLTLTAGADAEVPLGWSFVGFAFAIACAAVPAALSRQTPAAEETS